MPAARWRCFPPRSTPSASACRHETAAETPHQSSHDSPPSSARAPQTGCDSAPSCTPRLRHSATALSPHLPLPPRQPTPPVASTKASCILHAYANDSTLPARNFLCRKSKWAPRRTPIWLHLPVLEANERLKLIDTWLIFLRSHLPKRRAGPVRDDRVVRAASSQYRVVQGIDQVQPNLQRQRMIQLLQAEIALHRCVQLIHEVVA